MATALRLAAEVLDGAPLSVRAGRETVMLATEMGRQRRYRRHGTRPNIAIEARMHRKARGLSRRNAARSGRGADTNRPAVDVRRDDVRIELYGPGSKGIRGAFRGT